ncbi:mandelate racemase/muconate lactonizing enzyme family protein [Paenibacillus cymbidii]|uniref:mandelate racemase/muconate lactonizing enzyme family protein n=1 Tax=Paenibacillus cymbidii TaxID=1639034 RepID=UPI0010809E90|nr:mandelate racemase/muconate lactonizing enzyme family protein [Paenibacillus cymbidii]
METIKNVAARQLVVPLESPVWLGGYAVKQREYCLVELTTDRGSKGHALAFTRGANLADLVVSQLAPLIMNQPAGQIERLWEAMYRGVRLNGRQGALMRALSLVDIALWDLKSTTMNVPLHRLLGGYRDSVPVMMAGGYYSADKGIGELCREFMDYVDQGYRQLKLVVGGASMEEDLARFTAVRNHLPAGIKLGVDANGAWEDPKAVLRWIEQADRETGGLAFVEEPLPPEQRAGLAWLRQTSSVPLAVGEFIAGRWTFLDYMKEGCMDIVRADATLCGGVSEWQKIASMAVSWNLSLIPHYFAPLHLHLALALPGCSLIEVVSTAGRNSSFHLIAGRSYELKDGDAIPKHTPGLGYELDADFIAAHTAQVLSV